MSYANTKINDLSTQIEGDLIALLDDHYSLPETWDNELDAQIAKWYSNPPKVWPERDYPYFSPSSLGDCPRELYLKAKGAKKDSFRKPPHQGRWTAIGSAIGGVIQRDLLFIERNYEKLTGNTPKFRFLRDEQGRPMFEDFAKTNKLVEYNGEKFYLYGAPDGIMTYTTDSGDEVRVGLEVKSKQGTPARTSLHSMREAESSHFDQSVAYAEMFDCEYYVILYVNAAKIGWNMTAEQYQKTPDIRAFCSRITDEHKARIFDKAAIVTKSIRENIPPPIDISAWTFNNFKTACAQSLTDEEFEQIEKTVEQVKRSTIPNWKKQSYFDAYEFIRKERGGGGV